jgi:hypothetical protein
MWKEISGVLVNLDCFMIIDWKVVGEGFGKDVYELYGIDKINGDEIRLEIGKADRIEDSYNSIIRKLLNA